MKQNLKKITINIEFETRKDFRVAMDQIVVDMNRGINKRKYSGYSFEIRNDGTDENMIDNFRFEEINGQNCLIILSKLNKMKHD